MLVCCEWESVHATHTRRNRSEQIGVRRSFGAALCSILAAFSSVQHYWTDCHPDEQKCKTLVGEARRNEVAAPILIRSFFHLADPIALIVKVKALAKEADGMDNLKALVTVLAD